jgi:hypothetical protein
MKHLILIFAMMVASAAAADECLGNSIFTEYFCGNFKTKITCEKNPDSCYWGTVDPDNQCNIWNGDEQACATSSQCEWSEGGCSGDSAFCSGSDEQTCSQYADEGCSWLGGQCHLRQ